MDKQRFLLLIDKYLANETTLEEEELLAEFYNKFEPNEGVLRDPDMSTVSQEDILKSIHKKIKTKSVLFIWKKWMSVAAVAVVCGASILFWNMRNEKISGFERDNNLDVTLACETKFDKATLKLADGRSLSMEWANAFFYFDGGVSVFKSGERELVYKKYHDFTGFKGQLVNHSVTTGIGEKYKVVLPDGSNVWLNSSSTLVFSLNSSENRNVELIGEAYFDVSHDADKPFFIKTRDVSIKVLGTAFNVKAYIGESQTETSLVQGAIEMSVNKKPEQKVLLQANQKASFTVNNLEMNGESLQSQHSGLKIENLSRVLIGRQEYIEEIAWTRSSFFMENERMEELASRLEHWYNIRIKILDDDIKEFRFSGNIGNESIGQLLTAMQLIKPFKYKIIDDEVILF